MPGTHSAEAPGGSQDVVEDALDVGVIATAAWREADAARPPLEERRAEMLLEHADPVGDGGGGDPELLGGAGEALVPCCGVEEAETVERREGWHGMGDPVAAIERQSYFVIDRILIRHKRRLRRGRVRPRSCMVQLRS